MLVTDNNTLQNLISRIENDKFITIDTEFMRDKFYYPKLSLIQIGGEATHFAVDALSDIDLNLLKPLLSNQNIIKVLHSCKQDLEIFYNTFRFIPPNLFDSQIALQLLGYKDSPSYETLIRDFLNIEISKKLQFSEWLQRPLSDQQIEYALKDVSYLHSAYPKVAQKLKDLNRTDWLNEECTTLENDTNFYTSELDLLKKFVSTLENRNLVEKCLKILRLREVTAKKLNKTRNYILHDQDIITILKFNGLPNKSKLSQDEISNALDAPLSSDDHEVIDKAIAISKYRRGEKVESFLHLRKLLHKTAEEEQISPTLIATSDEIVKFSNGIHKKIRFLSGWRKEVFGLKAMKLV